MKLSPFQQQLVATIRRHSFNGSITTTDLVRRTRKNHAAVIGSLRALEAKGCVSHFLRGEGMRPTTYWSLT